MPPSPAMPPRDGLDRRLRAVAGHRAGVAEREVDVLVAVDVGDAVAARLVEVEREAAAPLGHPRHRHPAEQVPGTLEEGAGAGVGGGVGERARARSAPRAGNGQWSLVSSRRRHLDLMRRRREDTRREDTRGRARGLRGGVRAAGASAGPLGRARRRRRRRHRYRQARSAMITDPTSTVHVAIRITPLSSQPAQLMVASPAIVARLPEPALPGRPASCPDSGSAERAAVVRAVRIRRAGPSTPRRGSPVRSRGRSPVRRSALRRRRARRTCGGRHRAP